MNKHYIEEHYPAEQNLFSGLSIHFFGKERCTSGHSFGPALRKHFLMHFILKGTGIYQVNGRTYSVSEGMAFLIFPQELTYYKADDFEPWEYIWIAFDGKDAKRLIQNTASLENPYIYRFRDWSCALPQLLNFYAASASCIPEELLGHFYLIWSHFEHHCNKPTASPEKTYFLKARQYIHNNYGYSLSVEEIARFTGIDRTYLYRIFIQYANMSPKRYLTAYRIDVACQLLTDTELSITEIALSCGFSDSASFCKNFKALRQISPRAYRTSLGSLL